MNLSTAAYVYAIRWYTEIYRNVTSNIKERRIYHLPRVTRYALGGLVTRRPEIRFEHR